MHIKKISVLGSTGSVGIQTLKVAENLSFPVVGLAAHSNIRLLEEQIRKFRPKVVAVFKKDAAKKLRENIKDTPTTVLDGIEGLCEVASLDEIDITVIAVSGLDGIKPTVCAINAGKNVALANKETLVSGGELVMRAAKEKGVQILPIDSEHSAIFQCLQGLHCKNEIKNLILTASGGPFFGKPKSEFYGVTPEQAVRHPNWSMGKKISVDSATLMNKGLELIEAVHLFDISPEKIKILVHPQSIIHSMVEFCDNSVLAQMGSPTMFTPIQYALTYPEKMKSLAGSLDLAKIQNLRFFELDEITFELPDICKNAIKAGGTAPAIINAANEEAVNLFLDGEIGFLEIIDFVKDIFHKIPAKKIEKLEDILEVHEEVKEYIKSHKA